MDYFLCHFTICCLKAMRHPEALKHSPCIDTKAPAVAACHACPSLLQHSLTMPDVLAYCMQELEEALHQFLNCLRSSSSHSKSAAVQATSALIRMAGADPHYSAYTCQTQEMHSDKLVTNLASALGSLPYACNRLRLGICTVIISHPRALELMQNWALAQSITQAYLLAS